MEPSQFKIGDRSFKSRLIVGTGKYSSFEETRDAIAASGAEMITLAVRRIELDKNKDSILNFLDPKKCSSVKKCWWSKTYYFSRLGEMLFEKMLV